MKFFILCAFILKCFAKQENDQLFEKDEGIAEDWIKTYNKTEVSTLCDDGELIECHSLASNKIKTLKFYNRSHIEENSNKISRQRMIDYNNMLSDYWYYSGQIEYLGLIKKKPNLVEGFAKFLVACYFGNPEASYKIYVIMESEILNVIIDSKEFKALLTTSGYEFLNYIMTTDFQKNFEFTHDSEKKSIALQFLYSSALDKFQPALIALGNKFYRGFGLAKSCESALKYFKQSSQENIKEITNRHKPNFYEKVNLAVYEYVGHRFTNDNLDVDDIIDYFKVEAQNGQINYIQQLGQRYLYGQGTPQDFKQAFYYFEMGSKLNDSSCIYYLGEMYLNGWGTQKNYGEAFRLFSHAMTLNNSKAWNSLGYMYYYGLGIEKNIKRAYDYFKISFQKGEESDAYYNMATLITEGNGEIDVDFPNAYKFANFIAAKGHTFGTHLFGMLNEYQLGSVIKNCEITVEFFKQVSERNLQSKRKFDNGLKFYRNGMYKNAALLYIELAEEGFEFGQMNAAIILKNYDIFVDPELNKLLAYKYFLLAHKSRNVFATLNLADFYYHGFGALKKNFTKAYELYKEVITSTPDNDFYTAHAYFNLGQMYQYGQGLERNFTRALRYYNQSSSYDSNAAYPGLIMKQHMFWEEMNLVELIKGLIWKVFTSFTQPGYFMVLFQVSMVVYVIFVVSLYYQKENI